MTSEQFRRIALKLPQTIEASHMGHPDFRVAGKIFATLGYPDKGFGVVMVSPQDQDLLVQKHPKAFTPARGAWGRAGSTTVSLREADRDTVAIALEAAWRRRASKQVLDSQPVRKKKK